MSQEQVREFHEKNGLPVAVSLASIDSDVGNKILFHCLTELRKLSQSVLTAGQLFYDTDPRIFRVHLYLEELSEIAEALCLCDKIKLADALGDMDYINKGTAVVFNIPLERVFQEIHRSNMTKDVKNISRDRKNKGPNYDPPDLGFVG